MAGQHIYLEPILNALLGGIDTALAKILGDPDDTTKQKNLYDVTTGLTSVISKLGDVIGSGDKSLTDVVTSLGDVIGSGDKSLTDVVTELGTVNASISSNSPGVVIKRGTDIINTFWTFDNTTASYTKNYIVNASGSVNLVLTGIWANSGGAWSASLSQNGTTIKSFSGSGQLYSATYGFVVKQGDTLTITCAGDSSRKMHQGNFSLQYSLGAEAAADVFIEQ